MDPLDPVAVDALTDVGMQDPFLGDLRATRLGGSPEGMLELRSPHCSSGDFSDPLLGISAELEETQHAVNSSTPQSFVVAHSPSKSVVPTAQGNPEAERYSPLRGLDTTSQPWLRQLGRIRWRDEQFELGLLPFESALCSFDILLSSKPKTSKGIILFRIHLHELEIKSFRG
jgi:hypothetical protein